jgi:hypothetical protein
MKCYTINGTVSVSEGIETVDGVIRIGEDGRGRKLVSAPVPQGAEVVDKRGGPRFEIRWPNGSGRFRGFLNQGVDKWAGAAPTADEAAQIAAQGGAWAPCKPSPVTGRIVDVPAKNQPAGAVLVAIKDQSGFRGSWSLADRHGVIVLAEGACAQGDAGRMGGGPEYLAVIADGGTATINRSGRLYGKAETIRVRNAGGVLSVEEQKAASALDVL